MNESAPYFLVGLIVAFAGYYFLRQSARRTDDSLANCSDCGGTVHHGVPECRHCGATFSKPRGRKRKPKSEGSS